jgi:hypothetical protein
MGPARRIPAPVSAANPVARTARPPTRRVKLRIRIRPIRRRACRIPVRSRAKPAARAGPLSCRRRHARPRSRRLRLGHGLSAEPPRRAYLGSGAPVEGGQQRQLATAGYLPRAGRVPHPAAHVRCVRGSRRRDPHCLRARWRVVRCDRGAPAVPWHHRQRQGAGLCAGYRWVDASASVAGQGTTTAASQGAVARAASGFGDCPGGLPITALPKRLACSAGYPPGRSYPQRKVQVLLDS